MALFNSLALEPQPMAQNATAIAQADPARSHPHTEEHDRDHGPEEHGHEHALEWLDLVRIGLVALACLASWLGLWQRFASFDVIALGATLAGGYRIFKEAVANLIARRMTMELSMTIALAAALVIGEFFTALVIVLFVLVAEVLEGLTESNVGVAMGSGTDVARESADVVLLGNDLLKFVQTLQIARRCRRIIWFNFTGTLLVDSAGMGLAAFGMLNPLFAAFIHVSSELAFILNSARLLPAVSKR